MRPYEPTGRNRGVPFSYRGNFKNDVKDDPCAKVTLKGGPTRVGPWKEGIPVGDWFHHPPSAMTFPDDDARGTTVEAAAESESESEDEEWTPQGSSTQTPQKRAPDDVKEEEPSHLIPPKDHGKTPVKVSPTPKPSSRPEAVRSIHPNNVAVRPRALKKRNPKSFVYLTLPTRTRRSKRQHQLLHNGKTGRTRNPNN